MENVGYIYILTNPSFPEYVKIGYADDVNARLAQLNRSECTPFAFRVYATYAVDNRLSDKKIHNIIDTLNPSLRSIDNWQGKERKREFYAMSPEDAYAILEAIAEIHGFSERLTKCKMDEDAQKDASEAKEIEESSRERMSNFSFFSCNIQKGESIEFIEDPTHKISVVDDKNVLYEGKEYSLSALAKKLSGKAYSIAGPRYFSYKGEPLNDIRQRLGV
ncbi:GIY-YIG nuclease family protein [Succinivibrio faecicola]|uniref:GIY-YIG nuclease family protein n=1 Tax=Succinivibrio faecicola TaxID=2820300 RepID=A0ABS7DDW5_9GAMM|nr:GIY-YIG nuclease family protein [Succinivibrio faecicola]MBW7569500.1 GIY-YIG nuclease family protein [Succinivibrio faecicola]